MSKKKVENYVAEHRDAARAEVAGPQLLRAVRPVVERLKASPAYGVLAAGKGTGDVVGVYLTEPEVVALVEAVRRAEAGA